MDLAIERSSYKERDMVLIGSMFVLSLMVSMITMYDTSLCFSVPLFVVAFCCGYRYSIAYFLAVIVSCFILPQNQMLLAVSLTTFIILQIGVYVKFIKVKYIGVIVTAVTALFLYIYSFSYVAVAVILVLTLAHSYLFIELIPVFVHKTLDVYTDKRLMILSMIVMLCMTSLLDINQMYMLILLRFYILLSIFYLGMQLTMPCILYVSILLVLQNYTLKDDILAILLPCLIFFMYQPKTKLKATSLYVMSHLILPFFITYEYYYHGIIIVISALLFLVAPKMTLKKELLSKEFKELTSRNKLIQKANTFASLFKQLTTVFKETNPKLNTREYVGYMYEDLCSTCSCKDYCYHGKDGISRLGKLITKGIIDSYNSEDLQYIKETCIYPKDYIVNINKLNEDYHRIARVNQENQHLKNDLFYEFSLLSDIFDNFSASIGQINISEEHIREHLLGYQFEIAFLKKHTLSNQTYTLEIGLMNTTKSEVIEELLPILEAYLNETLDIVSIKDSMHHIGYTSIIVRHDVNYTLQHGFQQFSLDPLACGDSYMAFHQDMDHYLAISDGMGQGRQAAKESKLTLEVLSKLVLNGIGLKDTLDSINTLLRIKNQSDMFTTLDLCNINLTNARAKLIKYGSYSSFHIHNQEIEEIKCNSLPVGVISNVPMTSYEMTLQDNDLIIMASDGVGNHFKETIEDAMFVIEDMHPQEIATVLMDRVLEECNLDDISIMAIRIIKQK